MNKQEFSTDAACSKNPGPVEYRLVNNNTKEVLLYTKLPDGTNNIGEFLGLVDGIKYLQSNGHPKATLYCDSVTAMAWVRKKFANTSYKETGLDYNIIQLLLDAEHWLSNNVISVYVVKWDTKGLGEIPADFGRK